jgi:putative molybdopterin biosynthesis protein
MGSHDLAFDMLCSSFFDKRAEVNIFNLPVGSLDGLIALRQGLADLSGCHLFDPESAQYNSPFIKHFFPDQPVTTVTLAHRVQGMIIAVGNPKRISNLDDLTREDINFINRNRGSGTRIWLEHRLSDTGIKPDLIGGYAHETNSHSGISHAISTGTADVGIGLFAAADEKGLDFIPIFEEQYDLVFPTEILQEQDTQILLDLLVSSKYRNSIDRLKGYRSQNTGKLTEVKIHNDSPA